MRALALALLFSFLLAIAEGAVVQVDGRWSYDKYAPTLSAPEHYDQAFQAFQKGEWELAKKDFTIISIHYPDSPFYADSLYYVGLCQFYLTDYDQANKYFDRYLNLGGNLKHFEEIVDLKYQIANFYTSGKKKHLFGWKKLPCVSPARGDALKLYDEVIASLPNREIAAQALFGKGKLLRKRREYKEAVETLQTLARRFPKHSLAADGYLLIGEIYLEQSRLEAQNPDLLSHANINLQRFRRSFPGDERIATAEIKIKEMREVFAKSLYETGRYYERRKKPRASAIYFEEAVRRYPETSAATLCRGRLFSSSELAKK